jgi:hypothetical protein
MREHCAGAIGHNSDSGAGGLWLESSLVRGDADANIVSVFVFRPHPSFDA